jgi:peptidoglycan/xylan/chitin deacetylase (PgdA/CDA1 family)
MAHVSIPILMYHEIAPRPIPAFAKYTVTPHAFAMQMRWLHLAGYTSITLDEWLAHRNGQGTLPRRPVIITFDDGFQASVDHAVPVLRRQGMTAIFYLVAGRMGLHSDWLQRARGVSLPLIRWEDARQLETAGMHCGAHTMTHPRLTHVDAATCHAELADARALLESELGHPIRHLTYPHGACDPAVRMMAAASGYSTACTVEIGRSTFADDPLALRRIPISGHDTLADFVCRLRTGRSLRRMVAAFTRPLRRAKGVRPVEVT